MIRSVHHTQICIPVGAEGEARAFYCGVLGLKEVPKPESLAGRGGFWLEISGFQIHVGTEDAIDRAKSKAHVAYLVDDLSSWRKKLTAGGVRPTDGIAISGYDRFEFRDPFGNRIEFLEKI
jgi:catechol 2,3-dioxygenase-like lactoylglutathione lyase family enzyme